jgi:hypothetical protein
MSAGAQQSSSEIVDQLSEISHDAGHSADNWRLGKSRWIAVGRSTTN